MVTDADEQRGRVIRFDIFKHWITRSQLTSHVIDVAAAVHFHNCSTRPFQSVHIETYETKGSEPIVQNQLFNFHSIHNSRIHPTELIFR